MTFDSIPARACTTLAAAVIAGTASTIASAQSSVTVYGLTAVEAVHVTGVSTAGRIGTLNKLDNSQVTTSRLGFRGSEDLGGGLTAVFGLESQIGLDTGVQANAAKFFNRGSFVGIGSKNWGTVTAGRQWGINDDIMGRYFNFGGYAIFRFTEFGQISTQTDNAVKVVSPQLGGFQFRALVAAGEGMTGRAVEGGGTYRLGPFDAGATYRHAKGINGRADKLATVGASYIVSPLWRLRAGVSHADPQATGLPRAVAFGIGAVLTNGPVTVVADYVARNQVGTASDSRFLRFSTDYFFSKRTSLFLTLVKLKNDGASRERFYGDGAPGVDQNVSSLGLRHVF